MEPPRQPVPPFTLETATAKVQAAEVGLNIIPGTDAGRVIDVNDSKTTLPNADAWNTKDPQRVSKAYTQGSVWRNRSQFFEGREKIVEFLTQKWQKEHAYRLKKYLWCFTDNRIAVRFQYEYHNDEGQWFRAEGNEMWQFDEHGYMEERWASINDVAIAPHERRIAVP